MDSSRKENEGTRELSNRQCLIDPKTRELGSKHSCLRKMTTRTKCKQIHVKAEDHIYLEHGSTYM